MTTADISAAPAAHELRRGCVGADDRLSHGIHSPSPDTTRGGRVMLESSTLLWGPAAP